VSLLSRLDDGTTEVVEGTVASSSWRVERQELPALNGLLQIGTPGVAGRPGGPVVNGQNEVVGIVADTAGDWHHATPIDVAVKVSDDILRSGEADHARLGIEGYDLADTTLDEAARRDIAPGEAGVHVAEVFPDGPAADLLRSGDVIVTLGGVPVTDISALQTALLVHSPGDEVAITYYRSSDEEPRTASVTLDSRR
jgi:serine protease Do